MEEGFIRIEQLNKYYNRHSKRELHVINEVTLTLPKTGLVCILGESGSGKTTLMHAAGALDTFASGTIRVGDREIRGKMNRTAERLRNAEYGFVFQNYYLLDEETVQENLRLALCLYELSGEEQDSRIDYVLNAVDMLRYKKRRVAELSGGQRQRVAIARALVRTPQVIFADEPVGNLDESNTMTVMGILKKVSETALVVLTTHEKRIARFFADRIITICDGRIVSDTPNRASAGFRLEDDHGIYLDEYKKQRFSSENLAVEVYGEFETPLLLQVIEHGGMLYFSLPKHVKAEILGEDSELTIRTGKRLAVRMEEAVNADYRLERLPVRKKGTLSVRKTFAMVRQMLGSMRKKLLLPAMAMLTTAVLTVIAVSDFMTVTRLRPEEFVWTNSDYLEIAADKEGYMRYEEYQGYWERFLEEFYKDNPDCTLYPMFSVVPTYSNGLFVQMRDVSERFYGYSYTPLSWLEEDTLLYGRMPVAPNEIVVDQAVLRRFMAKETTTSQSVLEERYFLNQPLSLEGRNYTMQIVGISDGGEMSLYIDDVAGMGLAIGGLTMATLSSLQEVYPGRYDDVVLHAGEVLINEARTERDTYVSSDGVVRTIVGTFPEEFSATFVIAEADEQEILMRQLRQRKSVGVYTKDKDAVREYVAQYMADEGSGLLLTVKDQYGDLVREAYEAREGKVGARFLVTVMILVLSLLLLAIAMKSNAMNHLENISVYCLLGISKGSIVRMYALMILFLTLVTTLPGTLLCSGLLNAIAGIEALEFQFSFGAGATAATVGVLLAANLIVGLLPILRILRMPPAQMAARSDI